MIPLVALLVPGALARDVDLKVHDMKGVVNGEVSVELSEPGASPARFVCKDDGVAPDAVAGDHLYTAHAAGLALDHGTVVVRAGSGTWQGGFRFDDASDPVLLIGLEEGGFAAASTREVMFVPQDRMAPGGTGPGGAGPGGAAPGAGMPGGDGMNPGVTGPGGDPGGGTAGGTGGGGGAGTAGGIAPNGGAVARNRASVPDGMWLGWAIAAAALGGLGAVVWAGAARPARLPPLIGATPPATTAGRGPFVATESHTDLYLGPGEGACIADGRWSPDEVSLAALRVRGPVRIVVTDATRLEADGDGYAALSAALAGVADLLWVEPPNR